MLDPSDPTALEPGDVLVAPITDPSWTPLFVPAAAVVVDVGALQSHAVIVSRELGIPCVVSATGATQRIPSGARVRVDGAAGTVTVSASDRGAAMTTSPPRWISDTVASERYSIHSRANAGEVMPDPVSPLSTSWSLGGPGEWGWRDAFARMGTMDLDEFDVDRNDLIVVLGGYLYLNMSLTRLFGVRFPGLTPEMVDFQYFGEMPGIPTYASEARPTDESPVHTERLAQALGWIFSRDDLPELRDDREQIARLVARRPDIGELDLQEVVDYGRSHLPLLRRLFCRHIMMSATSGIGIAVVHQVCEAIGQPELTLTLVAALGDVDSAAPSWAMWDLSRMVNASARADRGVRCRGHRAARPHPWSGPAGRRGR